MGDTKIEWATKTWNPLRGCSKVSEGCRNCYAIRQAHRFAGKGQPYEGLTQSGSAGPNWTGKITLVPDMLMEPLKWRKPQRIFVNSMSDLFHPEVPDDFIDQVFAVMALCPQHTFKVLTKRPERMRKYLHERRENICESLAFHYPGDTPEAIERLGGRWIPPQYGEFGRIELQGYFDGVDIPWPLPNVWLGVSVENQEAADERIPLLVQTPAALRFLSCEPLLGPVDLWIWHKFKPGDPVFGWENQCSVGTPDGMRHCGYEPQHHTVGIDWVIVGGESGPGARPMHPEWARSLRDQCQEAHVPFYFKQWGEWREAIPDVPFYGNLKTTIVRGQSMNVGLFKFGKKEAGRLLDGRTWDEFPETEMSKC